MLFLLLIKNSNYNVMRLFFLCIIFLLVCSCNKGAYEPFSKGEISIQLNVSQQGETKAVPLVDEKMLSDINILFYDKNGNLAFSEYVEYPKSELSMDIYTDCEYSIYALANVGDISGDPFVKTVGGLMRMVHTISDKRDIVNSDGSIPMSASTPSVKIVQGSKISLSLVRLVSRFRLIVDTSELSDDVLKFDIKEVRLRNLNRNVSYFLPSKAFTIEDVLPIGESYTGDDLANLFTSGIDFYMLENAQGDLLEGNSEQESHIPPEEFAHLCTYVEIVVDYRSTDHYDENLTYRYYIHDGLLLDNFDILRNTMYLCTTRFVGSGINENSWRIDISGMKDLVTSLSLSPDRIFFDDVGDTCKIVPTVLPYTAENPIIEWKSTNEDVATVDSYGVVTATGDGECYIVASTMDGSAITASSKVVVITYKYPEEIHITPTDINMYVGDTQKFEVVILPEDADNKEVVWSSDNELIAQIVSPGEVKGISIGSCTISAKTKVGALVAKATVNVMDKDFILGPVPEVLYPNYNAPYRLSWSSDPSGTPQFVLTALAGDESAVFVSRNSIVVRSFNPDLIENGFIGRYRLDASLNGVELSDEFDVDLGSVQIDKTNLPSEVYILKQLQLSLSERIPYDVNAVWVSEDERVATVTRDGLVSFVGVGEARIRIRSVTGATDIVLFQVKEPTLSITNKVINTFEGYGVKVNVNATPQGEFPLTWQMVSGASYAEVDANGVVTGKRASGTSQARVRVSYSQMSYIYDEIDVIVSPAVSISLSDNNEILNISDYSSAVVNDIPQRLSLNVSTAPNTSVKWQVRDPEGNLTNDIRISSAGVVTALGNANGVYTIVGWDNTMTYSSQPLKIDVYKYMEYQIGLEHNGSAEIVENGELIRIVYSMNSKWDSKVASLALGIASPLRVARIICYPETAHASSTYIANSGNNSNVFARNVVHQEGYVPQFDVWDYLVPRSYLKGISTSDVVSGLKGRAYRFETEKHFYYLKQGNTSKFYNDGEFKDLK